MQKSTKKADLPPRLPNFNIKPEHVMPKTKQLIADVEATLTRVLSQKEHAWETLIEPIDIAMNELSIFIDAVAYIHNVANTPGLRKAYAQMERIYTHFSNKLGQNKKLFEAYKKLYARADELKLNATQRKILKEALRDFHLSGVDLPPKERGELKRISTALAKASTKFGNNVLDATHGWVLHVTDEKRLAGIPTHATLAAAREAKQKKKRGWLFTLTAPSYAPVMEHARDRALREEFYKAFNARASELPPHKKQFDNAQVMEGILRLRARSARILGFKNFAALSTSVKMAENPRAVWRLLNTLTARGKKKARAEIQALEKIAKEDGVKKLQPWDIAYYFERVREREYNFSNEDVRAYFPLPKVLSGMFTVIEKLYGVRFVAPTIPPKQYHNDVRYYNLYRAKKLIGGIYMDLYAREHKNGGAWANDFVTHARLGGALQLPVALLVCNFTPPIKKEPSYLTHYEVNTLFHEMGHALHVLLSNVAYADASGFNGVEWDAVELPSQFFENWAWDTKVLRTLLTEHRETKRAIPNALIKKMLAAKNYDSGYALMRQLMFACFDLALHESNEHTTRAIRAYANAAKKKVAVLPAYAHDRFMNAFSHIFNGGYAAGYYSYKWAEVLAADAFAPFKKLGILNKKQGRKFLDEILARGGSRSAMENFVAYRGREPEVDALLKQDGLV